MVKIQRNYIERNKLTEDDKRIGIDDIAKDLIK